MTNNNRQGQTDAFYFLQNHSLDDAFQLWLDKSVGHWDTCYWDGWRDVCNASVNDAIEMEN